MQYTIPGHSYTCPSTHLTPVMDALDDATVTCIIVLSPSTMLSIHPSQPLSKHGSTNSPLPQKLPTYLHGNTKICPVLVFWMVMWSKCQEGEDPAAGHKSMYILMASVSTKCGHNVWAQSVGNKCAQTGKDADCRHRRH